MIKTFLTGCIFLTSISAVGSEITSPFYLPQAQHIQTETSAQFIKNKIKESPTTRSYTRGFNEQITLGLGNGMAALLNGDLNWIRNKQTTTISYPHTIGYAVGLKGQTEIEGFLSQLTALYNQNTSTAFSPRRTIESHLRFGKELAQMTPYLHLAGTFPLNARPDFNGPIYRGETGVFQHITQKTTLDTALYLQYDKNIQERSYGIHGEWSYLITNWIALSLNGEWQARGKSHHTKTYHQMIGTKINFSF